MKTSIFFYKELTKAEVGKTGTHEIYIRFPNDFDYETFFHNSDVENGTVVEVVFNAEDVNSNKVDDVLKLRFVYFVNSNREKRIPSLRTLFEEHNIEEGDIVCLESRDTNGAISYHISFYKKGEIQISPNCICYSTIERQAKPFQGTSSNSNPSQCIKYIEIITAIKSKPFLLLAGISGTGKSRIVRELAFMSCPKYLQDKDGVTPGNYCMIEVKPNWHDSTELLGYYSNISREYQFKKFVKFLVKAKMHPEVPFFVCLDEMNLAPVEQYFAEILSILETRKHPKTDESVDMKTIKTEVLVEPQHFKYHSYKDETGAIREKLDMTDKDWYETFCGAAMMTEEERELINHYQYSRTLQQEGLSLPDNVIIIGTVNMDETTHQFSRKVIDRAMTIEMNGGRLVDMFGGSERLEYLPEEQQQKWQAAFRQRYVCADEVLELHPEVANDIRTKLPARLEEINKALRGTPFEVSYRVLNELTIMVGVMLDDNTEGKDIDAIISEAIDNILLMKILPRVEGDSDMFELSGMEKKKHGVEHDNRLKWLLALAPEITVTEEKGANHRQTAKGKIQEMIDRLDSHEFTRYWP